MACLRWTESKPWLFEPPAWICSLTTSSLGESEENGQLEVFIRDRVIRGVTGRTDGESDVLGIIADGSSGVDLVGATLQV